MFHHMYIASGRGRQSIGDKSLMTIERPFLFAHMLQVSKWSLRNLMLYTFLMILYMYITPGQGQKTPWGQNFDVSRKPLSLRPFVASFKQISLKSDSLNVFPHVYSPGAGADNPLWTKFWCQQKSLVTLPICCKFKKIYLWSLILYIIFHVFKHVYSPGAGADNYLGLEFLYKHKPFVTLVICCKFLPLNDFLTVFPTKSIRDQIWPCRKIGHGQPRVITWTNYDGPNAPMLHTKPQGHWPFGSREEDFWRVFIIYGCGGHSGHVTQTSQINFRSPIPLRLHMKFGFDWPSGFGEKDLWKVWTDGRRTDGRTADHGYTISSPMSLKAQVS